MQDYEMYEGEEKKGIINVFWDNINTNNKDSIIDSKDNSKYKVVSIDEDGQKYELEYIINDVDDIYDIVKKYIKDEKEIFNEIDKIKTYNNIRSVKKEQKIKVIINKAYLKKFYKTEKDIDKNSIVDAKIYFIKKACDSNKLDDIKKELDNIIIYFNNIINSNEYEFYDNDEKNKIADKAIESLDKLILDIENNTNYKYGKHFVLNIKIIM